LLHVLIAWLLHLFSANICEIREKFVEDTHPSCHAEPASMPNIAVLTWPLSAVPCLGLPPPTCLGRPPPFPGRPPLPFLRRPPPCLGHRLTVQKAASLAVRCRNWCARRSRAMAVLRCGAWSATSCRAMAHGPRAHASVATTSRATAAAPVRVPNFQSGYGGRARKRGVPGESD
jgi:hypothetical protein